MVKSLFLLLLVALPAHSLDTKERLINMHAQGLISDQELKKKFIEIKFPEPEEKDRDIASTIQPIKVYRFTNPPLEIK